MNGIQTTCAVKYIYISFKYLHGIILQQTLLQEQCIFFSATVIAGIHMCMRERVVASLRICVISNIFVPVLKACAGPSVRVNYWTHNSDVIMSAMASQITDVAILCSRTDQSTSKLRNTGLCEGDPSVTDGFPSQRASNAENVSI